MEHLNQLGGYIGAGADIGLGLFTGGYAAYNALRKPQISAPLVLSQAHQAGLARLANYQASRTPWNPQKDALVRNGWNNIPRSANGLGPDFAGTPYLFPVQNGQSNIVRITLTGNLTDDFATANARGGFTNGKPANYTWHHLDDFDPTTGQATLQLVRTEVHRAAAPHAGGVKQWELFNDRLYQK